MITPTPREILHASTTTEWYTPPWLVDRVRLVMGSIYLDPASCEFANRWIRADHFLDINSDGLERFWGSAFSVWLNPPYGRQTSKWVEKFINENFPVGMMLVNNTTDRQWFRRLWDYYLCFFYRRIKFIDTKGIEQPSPTHGNVLVYRGSNPQKFQQHFENFGRIVKPG